MGKRSDFTRRPQDAYPTPLAAVLPLLPYLKPGTRYIEPCCGEGHLIKHLKDHATCVGAFDISAEYDARGDEYLAVQGRVDCFITNPPWSRDVLHPIILNLSNQLPAWLLFDADWVHTRQSTPYMSRLRKIVSVGRVKWIEGTKHAGKDNAAWHLFEAPSDARSAQFYGRGS